MSIVKTTGLTAAILACAALFTWGWIVLTTNVSAHQSGVLWTSKVYSTSGVTTWGNLDAPIFLDSKGEYYVVDRANYSTIVKSAVDVTRIDSVRQ